MAIIFLLFFQSEGSANERMRGGGDAQVFLFRFLLVKAPRALLFMCGWFRSRLIYKFNIRHFSHLLVGIIFHFPLLAPCCTPTAPDGSEFPPRKRERSEQITVSTPHEVVAMNNESQ